MTVRKYSPVLGTVAIIAAIGFGIAGTFIAPQGIIDSSMLMLIAQLLVYSATAIGFGEALVRIYEIIHGKDKD